MQETIRVHVVDKGRRNLYMRYRCPVTGKDETRSTGTAKPREAAKVAAKWEAELQEGRYKRKSRMGWEQFRAAWERANEPAMSEAGAANYSATFNAVERLCKPALIASLSTAVVTEFTAGLRAEKKSEASVARHLRHLKSIARWANRQGYLRSVPAFDMPKRKAAAKMKGRPITTEEFERMLGATPKALGYKIKPKQGEDKPTIKPVGDEIAESWRVLLRGLWWSGLRLREALALRWDHQAGGVSVRLDGPRSVLVFDTGSQKSGKAEIVPLAPEAVEFLDPMQRSAGYVFNPRRRMGKGLAARDPHKVSKAISSIGDAAGVIVDAEGGKTASAHDQRRAFGFRWSRRVMPAELRELMRHASIETTMTYYVGQNAYATAASLWAAVGDTSGDTPATDVHRSTSAHEKTPANAGALK